jgi:hypothetical protein
VVSLTGPNQQIGHPTDRPFIAPRACHARNYSGRFRWLRQEWAPIDGTAEVLEYRQTVFAQCRNVAADAGMTAGALVLPQRPAVVRVGHGFFFRPQHLLGKGIPPPFK